ncbi:MAG TPA: hypothetical protein VHE30_09770 [Polyangiaceae bacterium]|nr:hypothetical protein [Polyangiaceae bacterium]
MTHKIDTRKVASAAALGLTLGTVSCKGNASPKPETTSASASSATQPVAKNDTKDKACCKGLNDCKGKGGCSVAGKHECAGKNECKGQGGCNMHCPQ